MKKKINLCRSAYIYVIYVVYVIVCFLSVYFVSRRTLGFEIYFFSVGNGDSFLVKYKGFDLLIDGGPGDSLDYYLNRLYYPICKIDSVLLTHPHMDHTGGLQSVSKNCKVNIFFNNNLVSDSKFYKNLLNNFEKRSKIVGLSAGDSIFVDDLHIYVVWPSKEELWEQNLGLNSLSTALFIDYFDFEALLLSDIEKDAQDKIDLFEYMPLVQGRVDVLKIPHHGSKDALNKDFFNKVNPKNVVLSVGKNSYGHPAKETMDFLKSKDTKIYRTDKDGTIKFKHVK